MLNYLDHNGGEFEKTKRLSFMIQDAKIIHVHLLNENQIVRYNSKLILVLKWKLYRMRYREEKKKRSFKWLYIVVIIVFIGWVMMEEYGSAVFEDETIEVGMP